MQMMNNNIGNRLKELRKYYHYTVQEIASLLNHDIQYIQALEYNQCSMSVNDLEKLCILYNVTEDVILNDDICYLKQALNHGTNNKNVDVYSRYKMNKIIRNLIFLHDINYKKIK